MAEEHRIHCVRGSLGAADAAALVGLEPLPAQRAQKVYAPHYWFVACGSSPTLFGRRDFAVDCLVDACSGDAATADRFSVDEELSNGLVLPTVWSADDAERVAVRRTLANLSRQLRTLADFHVDVELRGLIYKPCWLLPRADEHVLIDALTGGWYSVATGDAAAAALT
ncbi:MAG: hypothetical protein AAF417_10090 [Pseudomonadota bacterium]